MGRSVGKVVFLLPSMEHGGAEKVFCELCQYLYDAGHDVQLICLDKTGGLVDVYGQVPWIEYLSEPGAHAPIVSRVIQWWKLRRLVDRQKAKRVVSTITGMNLFTLLCFGFDRKVEVWIREASSLENTKSGLKRVMMRILYRFADKIICTSDYVAHQLADGYVNKPEKLELMPNPVDVSRIVSLAQQPLPSDINIESTVPLLVAVGRLVPAKGYDVLIDAVRELTKRRPVRLLIVGDGPQGNELEDLIRQYELSQSVILMGYLQNPYPYIANARVFILSSRWEGYVNVLIEAMVLQRPIVATDCNSGPGKLLKDRMGMELCPVGDAMALANFIQKELESGDVKKDYSSLVKLHDIEHIARFYLER